MKMKRLMIPSPCEDYRKLLTRDILPMLKGLDLGDVTRDKVKALALPAFARGNLPKPSRMSSVA